MLNRISQHSRPNASVLALAIGAVLGMAAAPATAVQPDVPPDLTASSAQSVLGEGPGDYFYRNISKTPELASSKSKLEALTIYVPAIAADETPIADAAKVHPMIVTYADENATTGAADIWAAVSRDEGATWKRMNLSRSAEKSSIDVNGMPYYGDARKASIKTMDNLVLVSWTSKYCPANDPSGLADVPDKFLVKGPQGVVDYAATYGEDYAVFGVVPYSCVWAARGMIDAETGAITWFAPEQITSGRRDALQDWPFAAKGAGFAIAWQEDPDGLDPGQAKGPGEGMSGATVNHQTDIWYSFITKDQFTPVDEAAIVSDDALGDGKPKPLYGFSSPVRVTDNASCKVDGEETKGLPVCELEPSTYCVAKVSLDGENTFCKTSYGVVLDGDTGASRPNMFMFPKTLSDGTVTAEVGLMYEETKGLGEGGGKPEDVYAMGKLVRYHYFGDFRKPEIMRSGTIVNQPALNPKDGTPLLWEDGTPKYENARRGRFILQSKGGCGDTAEAKAACTTMVIVYKQGIEGQGRQSDVMMRRAVAGYDLSKSPLSQAVNLSSPSVLATEPASNEEGVDKVTAHEWTEDDLATESWENPYDDARAQRGVIRGDTLLVGFSWTPNWAAARNGNDHYDFFVRWSDDGGKTFKDPATGVYAAPHNVSNLKNNFSTVIEPRTIGTPGSIKQADGTFYSPDDKQNGNVFFLAYGTATNVDTNLGDDDESDEGEATPEDIFFTWTEDAGATYKTVLNLNASVDPDVPVNAMLAARNDAAEGEVQLRTTPSGLKLYAVWNHDGPVDGTGGIDGSDVGFRKIENLPDLYDLSGDGVVDLSDQIIFRANMGACEGKKKFNPAMDYDNDNCITLGDYAKWSQADLADGN